MQRKYSALKSNGLFHYTFWENLLKIGRKKKKLRFLTRGIVTPIPRRPVARHRANVSGTNSMMASSLAIRSPRTRIGLQCRTLVCWFRIRRALEFWLSSRAYIHPGCMATRGLGCTCSGGLYYSSSFVAPNWDHIRHASRAKHSPWLIGAASRHPTSMVW